MTLIWTRVGSRRLGILYHRYALARRLINQNSTLSAKLFLPTRCSKEVVPASSPSLLQQFISVRCFAAPVSASAKKVDVKVIKATRINEEITAAYLRLVDDEGHAIVTREEALHRAKTAALDLVEVSSTANPPVCKIMDFHQEKFKKAVRDKELAKSKADITVRKGDCKEVHFTGKTEQKDLKMKAETVKRLMERGYRVKIVAEKIAEKTGNNDSEREDLQKVLDRLYNLIEDISAVESPPIVGNFLAYLIVRHAKFGTKKSPAKKSSKNEVSQNGKVMEKDSTLSADDHGVNQMETLQTTNHVLETVKKFDHESDNMKNAPINPRVDSEMNQKLEAYRIDTTKPRHDSSDHSTVRAEAASALSNRYKKSDTSTRFCGRVPHQPSFNRSQGHSNLDMNQRPPVPNHPNTRGSFPSQFSPEDRNLHAQLDLKQHHPFPGHHNSRESFSANIPRENNQKHVQLDSKNQQSIPYRPRVPPSNYGISSSFKTAASEEQRKRPNVNTDNRESTPSVPKSKDQNPAQDSKTDRKWGIFSR